MLRRSLLKAFLAAPLGLLLGIKKSQGQPKPCREDIDKWLEDCAAMITEKLGWPKGSFKFEYHPQKYITGYGETPMTDEEKQRICNIDASKPYKGGIGDPEYEKWKLEFWRKILK